MNLQNTTFITPCTPARCEEWLFLTTPLGSGAQSASKCRGILSPEERARQGSGNPKSEIRNNAEKPNAESGETNSPSPYPPRRRGRGRGGEIRNPKPETRNKSRYRSE